MSEQEYPIIHICRPIVDKKEIIVRECPTCKSDQEFLAQHQEWYGWSHTCLNCGDRWNDGEREARPFCRGWRKISIERAKEQATKAGLKFAGNTEV